MHTHTHTRTYLHTHTHTHARTHIHTHTFGGELNLVNFYLLTEMFVEINRFRNRQVGFEIPLINNLKSQLYTQICQVKWLLSWLLRMRCRRSKFSKDSTLISENFRKWASILEISSRHSWKKRHPLKKKSEQECLHVSECADIFFKRMLGRLRHAPDENSHKTARYSIYNINWL